MNAYKDKEAMPYERFLKFGAESLTDTELLAIILRTGTKEKNALELAGDILHLQGNMQGKLVGLHQLSLAQLKSIPGIGEVKAIKVKAIGELARRMASKKRNYQSSRHKQLFPTVPKKVKTIPLGIMQYFYEIFYVLLQIVPAWSCLFLLPLQILPKQIKIVIKLRCASCCQHSFFFTSQMNRNNPNHMSWPIAKYNNSIRKTDCFL